MIDTSAAQKRVYGSGKITTDTEALCDVAMCFDFTTARLGFQIADDRKPANLAYDKLATVAATFYTPWGPMHLEPRPQWTTYSTRASWQTAHPSALWGYVADAHDWSYTWLHAHDVITFETSDKRCETLYVGPCCDFAWPCPVPDGPTIWAKKGAVTVFDWAQDNDAQMRMRAALSLANGAPLRLHSWQEGNKLCLTGNRYEGAQGATNPLTFTGYPWLQHDLAHSSFVEVVACALKKFEEDGTQAQHNVLRYLDARVGRGYDVSHLTGAMGLIEYLDGSKTMNKQTLQPVFQITQEEAEALKKFRNGFMHSQGDPVELIKHYAAELERLRPPLYQIMAQNIQASPELRVMQYVMSLCDRALLRWIGYDGLAQTYFPTTEAQLRLWQTERPQ